MSSCPSIPLSSSPPPTLSPPPTPLSPPTPSSTSANSGTSVRDGFRLKMGSRPAVQMKRKSRRWSKTRAVPWTRCRDDGRILRNVGRFKVEHTGKRASLELQCGPEFPSYLWEVQDALAQSWTPGSKEEEDDRPIFYALSRAPIQHTRGLSPQERAHLAEHKGRRRSSSSASGIPELTGVPIRADPAA
ncbi:hypothetical protein OF83DRAFT_1082093 [Amylostereum chailletii]|nr:hypothetical protein OF83DRAFT_1082093 [Amylostereum chailletii]